MGLCIDNFFCLTANDTFYLIMGTVAILLISHVSCNIACGWSSAY